jgi:predicted Zn-dependent protease
MMTNRKASHVLDTLAAAYAETGQFDNAVAAQKEAMALVLDERYKQDCSSRLKLYEAKTPYRERE